MTLPRDVASSRERPKIIANDHEIGWLRLAWGHAMWRNNLVAKVFCYLSVMRAADIIPANSKALVSPASLRVPQDFQASGNAEAAHYLPGFVAIQASNQQPKCLWELISDITIRRNVEDLFRATQDLSVSYNRADSAAEVKRLSGPPGLKQLFQECCQGIIDEQPLRSRNSGEVLVIANRPLVTRFFCRWAEGSIEAYRFAAAQKTVSIGRNRPADVRGSGRTDFLTGVHNEWTSDDLKARARDQERIVHGRKSTVQEFSDQESFLRAYANATTESFPLAESNVHDIEAPFSVSRSRRRSL